MKITINDQTFDLTNEQEVKLKKALGINGKQPHDVEVGDTFTIAGIEFIKFEDEGGVTTAVTKDIIFNSRFDFDNNDFSTSELLPRLNKEILHRIEVAIGADNVYTIETNLKSLDGHTNYGTLVSKVSLPTFDFYRKHVDIFDKHKVNVSWWLSTPWSTKTHGCETTVCLVRDDGALCCNDCYCDYGVRPLFHFKSSIFVS